MSDPSKLVSTQELNVIRQAEERDPQKGKGKKEKKESEDVSSSILYSQGLTLLSTAGYTLELQEGGDHCNFTILKPLEPPDIKGIECPHTFKPLQEIYAEEDLQRIDDLFKPSSCSQKLRDFWTPLFRPKTGDSELFAFTVRKLKMIKSREKRTFEEPVRFRHSFDPAGRINGKSCNNPKVWVPDREWFHPALQQVKLEDVFSIFPEAEIQILKLLLGRIGVGRSGHIPEGWSKDEVVKHTARMAAVIVGKDPGLGKSTLFNGMISAFSKCGFTTQTFRSTEEKFGMKPVALSDIAYKDDTSLATLKKFLSSEETKTIITNGRFQVEDKFMQAEQVNPKTVFLVNANDWNNKFAYDLDPGIRDRIKLVSTLREVEVEKKKDWISGTVSEGSPDLRPRSHLPYLAKKLDVSEDALYLWCLRLSTDYFWEVINDNSDPSVNRLQSEVRYWTTRLRIMFKTETAQALVNSLAICWTIRTKNEVVPELNPTLLRECLQHFFFIGVDPSAQDLVKKMKKRWHEAGRPTTHYYQGFRDVRWESVGKAYSYSLDLTTGESSKTSTLTFADTIKNIMEKLDLRDGYQIGGTANYIIESWENMRHGSIELLEEARELRKELNEADLARIDNLSTVCYDRWLENKTYSPDLAEGLREEAKEKIYKKTGVK